MWYSYLSQPCQSPKNLISFYSFHWGCAIWWDGTWMPLCVYNWWGSFFWWEKWWHICFYFFGWGGGQGSCLYFWVMMFLFWHICAVSACKHEPFDCTVVSFLSLQVVQPIGTLGLIGRLCPSHEGTQSCYFCLGFISGLDKSLFVWK